MSEREKGLEASDLASRTEDLAGIHALEQAYGDLAWPVLRRQYLALGYAAGVERLTRLLSERRWSPDALAGDPVAAVRDWLEGHFTDRGGAMPEIWAEETTVYLRTRGCRECVTIEAEKTRPVGHREVCYVYCRAWAEGYVSVLADLAPGLQINYHNLDSRRDGAEHDCVEAFQVVAPR
ncbi:hypothetical protein GF314_09220 [bacterium]|nr:hypothetical protein [bacterium]